jgi:hypothetical protein
VTGENRKKLVLKSEKGIMGLPSRLFANDYTANKNEEVRWQEYGKTVMNGANAARPGQSGLRHQENGGMFFRQQDNHRLSSNPTFA